jgi:hypothetical protein
MKHIYTIILFILVYSQVHALSSPVDGLKEISSTGSSTGDGYTFHFYSADGKLNRGFSEVYIALTDTSNNFVEDFTVSNFLPFITDSSKHSTPVGKVEKVEGKALYKTWFSFLTSGTWSLGFNYTIGGTATKSSIITTLNRYSIGSAKVTVINDTITQVGWFKDRNCVGAVTLPLTKSCGIGCGTGSGGMAGCWNSGLGVFIYNATDTGKITQDSARSDAHYLLFDAQSKELTRAFLLSLPSEASGKISIKVTGYKVPNGISLNKTETQAPELVADSIDHYLTAFHLLSIEGVVIENQSKSYLGFDTISYKLTPADLAPSNLSVVKYSEGDTVKFTPPVNAAYAKSNLKGYKVRVYNNSGVLQDTYTTTINDSSVTAIHVSGLKTNAAYTFTVSALYPGSDVEVESEHSSIVEPGITGITLSVDDYSANSKWIQSFTFNNTNYYVSVVNPKDLTVGSQTVKAYINKQEGVLLSYPVVESGFKIVPTPFMRSMGHGSDGNTDLEWNADDSVYEGTLNFSMEGDWRINLKIFDSAADTLIAGVDIDEDGNGSTHYWDIYLDSTTTTTGTKDVKSAGILVYPSISHGEITIVTPAEAKVKVVDLSGKILETHQLSESKTIYLNVKSGLYLVSVESSNWTFIQKVIVIK